MHILYANEFICISLQECNLENTYNSQIILKPRNVHYSFLIGKNNSNNKNDQIGNFLSIFQSSYIPRMFKQSTECLLKISKWYGYLFNFFPISLAVLIFAIITGFLDLRTICQRTICQADDMPII